MKNKGLLIANEPVSQRADTLCRTFERLGVTNAVVTCMQPDALCPALNALCDLVLVDAPCSGEGMFRKEAEAVAAWSGEHVHACAIRQKAILSAAARAVRPGGTLIYSTCTFSFEENEGVVEDFLSAHSDFTRKTMRRLYPHTCAGEGQFAAVLCRAGSAAPRNQGLTELQNTRIPAFEEFCAETLSAPLPRPAQLLPDGRVILPPALLPAEMKKLHVRIAGIPAGEVRGTRFIPSHALFLALPASAFRCALPLSGEALARYFAGETVPVPANDRGYCAVAYEGHPVGFGKADGKILKNHYPKGLRIR